jgi:hypothetical protein|tara:strand:+ start:266 stop:688 length:423 start_codon:yes stop_codon:yes gene_type:complete
MNKKQISGIISIIASFLIVTLNINITGAVIGSSLSNYLSILAIAFFVVGIGLFITSRDRNYAQEYLDKRKYVSSTRILKSIARKMGYNLIEGFKEGTRVYNGNNVLNVIPNSREVKGKGTSKSILESLATGISNFRKRTS